MYKIGNLFFLAEKKLIKENRPYKLVDIIDCAVKIRKFLDKNENELNTILSLSEEEKRIRNNEYRKRYYLKYRR